MHLCVHAPVGRSVGRSVARIDVYPPRILGSLSAALPAANQGHYGSPACPFLTAEWAAFVPLDKFATVVNWFMQVCINVCISMNHMCMCMFCSTVTGILGST